MVCHGNVHKMLKMFFTATLAMFHILYSHYNWTKTIPMTPEVTRILSFSLTKKLMTGRRKHTAYVSRRNETTSDIYFQNTFKPLSEIFELSQAFI